jgi:hypothetical protein
MPYKWEDGLASQLPSGATKGLKWCVFLLRQIWIVRRFVRLSGGNRDAGQNMSHRRGADISTTEGFSYLDLLSFLNLVLSLISYCCLLFSKSALVFLSLEQASMAEILTEQIEALKQQQRQQQHGTTQSSKDSSAQASAAGTEKRQAFPKGVVLDKDGKPFVSHLLPVSCHSLLANCSTED